MKPDCRVMRWQISIKALAEETPKSMDPPCDTHTQDELKGKKGSEKCEHKTASFWQI